MVFAGAGNVPFWAVFGGAMLLMLFYYRWWFSKELMVRQQQAITTALAEGCCAGCLYGLRDLDRSHERTTCPECGAVWNTARIGELRGAITHAKAIEADEARIGASAANRAPQGVARWFFGDKWMLALTAVDARGRRVRLVDGRLFSASNRESRLSAGQLLGARRAMAQGRCRAILITLWLTATWAFVLWLQISMVMKTGMGVGITGLWQVIVKFLLIVMIPIGFIGFMRQYYPRLRGWKPSRAQPAADALASLSICACCGEPLNAQPEADGATVCAQCGASWKTGPQTSKP
jgi:hypothetical protein